MPHRLIARDQFYAGETITYFSPILDDEDRPITPAPDDVVVSAKKESDGSSVHGELTMLLVREVLAQVSSIGTQTIKVEGAGWEPGRFIDAIVRFTSGTALNAEVRIADNTADTLIFRPNPEDANTYLPAGVAVGNTFAIHRSEYEASWDSPDTLADTAIIATFKATKAAPDAYTNLGKLRIRLRGNPP